MSAVCVEVSEYASEKPLNVADVVNANAKRSSRYSVVDASERTVTTWVRPPSAITYFLPATIPVASATTTDCAERAAAVAMVVEVASQVAEAAAWSAPPPE